MADNRRAFAKQLLTHMRNLPAGGVADWPAEMNEYALRVKTRLTELAEFLDARALNNYNVIEYTEQLKKELEDVMSSALTSQAGGMVGNAMRIGGVLANAHPLGQALFYTGLATTLVCDWCTGKKGERIQELSQEINAVLNRDADFFRPLAGAIRRLDETLIERTGSSIYDEELQEFLRVAALPREREQIAVPCGVVNVEHRNNLIALARNGELIRLLGEISQAINREDLIFLKVVSYGFLAMGCFHSASPNEAAAWQVAEFGMRGITMFLDYKRGKVTLKRIGNEIERMRKQLKAMKEVAPYL